jgi:tripartite-type tricarboxylate transporter receptor subunit TctC
MISRRRMLASLGAFAAAPALAQSASTVLIVPFAPGGPTDIIGRIAAEGLSRRLGRRLIVENVAGAGGATGVVRAMRAAPDGRTLLVGNLGTHGAAPSATPNLPYDPVADFEPIGMIAETPIVLVARKDFPADDLTSFASQLRTHPDRYSYGHAGQGVTSHTAALLLLSSIGAMQTGVAYRGTAPALNDLLAGSIDFIVDQSVIMVEQVRGGAVKALAVAGARRLPSLPDLPTAAEQGLPAFAITAWNALFAPAGLDKGLAAELERALAETLDDPEVQARLTTFDAIVPEAGEARSAARLRAHVTAEVERWRNIAR